MDHNAFRPLKTSVPDFVDKLTIRPSYVSGNTSTNPVRCYRHFVVNAEPTIRPKTASDLVPILPRPPGVAPTTPTFVSDNRGAASPSFRPNRSNYHRDYREKAGVRARRNQQQRLRRLRKKHIADGVFLSADDASHNFGVLYQTIQTTHVQFVDVFHRYCHGKHTRMPNDKYFFINRVGDENSEGAVNSDSTDQDYVPTKSTQHTLTHTTRM